MRRTYLHTMALQYNIQVTLCHIAACRWGIYAHCQFGALGGRCLVVRVGAVRRHVPAEPAIPCPALCPYDAPPRYLPDQTLSYLGSSGGSDASVSGSATYLDKHFFRAAWHVQQTAAWVIMRRGRERAPSYPYGRPTSARSHTI